MSVEVDESPVISFDPICFEAALVDSQFTPDDDVVSSDNQTDNDDDTLPRIRIDCDPTKPVSEWASWTTPKVTDVPKTSRNNKPPHFTETSEWMQDAHNKSVDELASQFGVCKRTIQRAMANQGISREHLPRAHKSRLTKNQIVAHAQATSQSNSVASFGVSRSSLTKWKKMEMDKVDRNHNKVEAPRIKRRSVHTQSQAWAMQQFKNGRTVKQVAKDILEIGGTGTEVSQTSLIRWEKESRQGVLLG